MNLFVTRTNCLPGWPAVYRTYHQELEPPYRHASWCVVVRVERIGSVVRRLGAAVERLGGLVERCGVVVGRWTQELVDEDAAHTVALGARPIVGWWDECECPDEPDDGAFGCLVAQ